MLQHIVDRFKRKPSKVLLTGEDIISLRDDVNSALSVSAKLVYQLEELEIRVAAIEERIRLFTK